MTFPKFASYKSPVYTKRGSTHTRVYARHVTTLVVHSKNKLVYTKYYWERRWNRISQELSMSGASLWETKDYEKQKQQHAPVWNLLVLSPSQGWVLSLKTRHSFYQHYEDGMKNVLSRSHLHRGHSRSEHKGNYKFLNLSEQCVVRGEGMIVIY